ncbi:hypothetical protein JW887_01550 [Candidatus Dojkabacteria bacterium]|nr:hypothetical protein [Candidatus Dojkabacteria bacterium]
MLKNFKFKIPDNFKRHAITDIVVVLLIIVGMVLFGLLYSPDLGWEIAKGQEKISNEDKIISENVLIYDKGSLMIEDSSVSIDSKADNLFGFFVEGDTKLKIVNSSITSENFRYFFSLSQRDDKNPQIEIKNSSIKDNSWITLNNRSKLTAYDSEIGEVRVYGNSIVYIEDSTLIPAFSSDEKETFKDLKSGENIDMQLESESGWKFESKSSNIPFYKILMAKGNDVNIVDSSYVVVSFLVNGLLADEKEINLSEIFDSNNGSFDDLGSDLSWQNSNILMAEFLLRGDDSLILNDGSIGQIYIYDDSNLGINKSKLYCDECIISGSAEVTFDDIKFEMFDGYSNKIQVFDNSILTIKNSDLSNTTIELYGKSRLVLQNVEFDESNILTYEDSRVEHKTEE